jgi:Flp pilus assembly protein TadD
VLERAERRFYASLFVNPRDDSAVNGLGSVLFHRRDLDAAEFFVRRALQLARKRGVTYAAAAHDLELIRATRRALKEVR